MSDKIRVGLVGYGFASKTFHAPLIAGTAEMELAAVSSSDASKVHADWPSVQVVSDPQALFDDPTLQLIVIPTPNDTHFPLAKAALNAGKHVVVDKPFTVTLSQARELDALAKSKGLLLSVFHNRRWDSDFLTVKALLAEGTLGDVRYFESHFDRCCCRRLRNRSPVLAAKSGMTTSSTFRGCSVNAPGSAPAISAAAVLMPTMRWLPRKPGICRAGPTSSLG